MVWLYTGVYGLGGRVALTNTDTHTQKNTAKNRTNERGATETEERATIV